MSNPGLKWEIRILKNHTGTNNNAGSLVIGINMKLDFFLWLEFELWLDLSLESWLWLSAIISYREAELYPSNREILATLSREVCSTILFAIHYIYICIYYIYSRAVNVGCGVGQSVAQVVGSLAHVTSLREYITWLK